MIRMEYPKANIEGLSDREKIIALKRQLDTLTNNVQLVLESIDGDLESVNGELEGVSETMGTMKSNVTNLKEDHDTRIDALENNVGAVYDAPWFATSSAANGVILTNTLTLPKGTYVVVASIPPTTNAMAFGLYDTINGYANRYISVIANHYASATWIVNNPEESMGINLRSAGSASVTYTNGALYGRLRAIRIGTK